MKSLSVFKTGFSDDPLIAPYLFVEEAKHDYNHFYDLTWKKTLKGHSYDLWDIDSD